ncbi:MAG: ubiquinol-cytochrome C chaperone family protein [Rhodospirillales bacterium]|nr:ubiquinol-cytochrome C chaperone family protein [Rhodospirillales bacterium]
MAVRHLLPSFRRGRHERAGFALYSEAAAAARDPHLYAAIGVPDTLDGRFDALALCAVLLIERLRAGPPPGAALAQAVFDAMFSDLDLALREMGAGDPTVPRKMRDMWNALHGRAIAYGPALAAGDAAALAEALARNVWRGAPPGPDQPAALARFALAQAGHLAAQPEAAFAAGTARFLPVPEATR